MKLKKTVSMFLAFIILAVSTSLTVLAESYDIISPPKATSGVDTNEWLISGARYDDTNRYFVLTEDYSSWQAGAIWYNHPYEDDFTIDLDYYTGSSDRSLGGADGIVVAFFANYSYTMSSGENIGFTGCGGFGVELDTYRNTNQGDPINNHIALIKDNVGTHLTTNSLTESEDEQWHHLRIIVSDSVCTAYIDGNEKFSHPVEATGYGWIGITSATGNGHNLHAVSNVVIKSNKSAAVGDRYLDLDLSHRKISNNCTEDDINGVYEYEITAEIKNSADATANDITAIIELNDGLRVADEASLSIDIGDVNSGESAIARWTVYADWPEVNIAANYRVTVNIGDATSFGQENYIYLLSRNENDNTFILGVDEWNFPNSYGYFDPDNNEDHYMTNSDYEALVSDLSYLERDLIIKYWGSKWGGSCYGMSVLAILVKMGIIEPTIIQDGADTLYSISKVNNDKVESLITFYHMQQKTDISTANKIQFALQSTDKQLEEIESKAIAVSTGGSPFLLAFCGNKWGHAVVAYGIERGDYYIDSVAQKYDSRILIYDCSNLLSPEDSYLYYNSGTDEWYIPRYSDASKLVMACNDIAVLDCVNYEVSSANNTARLVFVGEGGYYMNYNGSRLAINGNTDMRSEGIIAFYDANLLADGTYGTSELTLTLPDLTGNYTVIPSAGTSEFTMYYEDTVLSVDCDTAEQIEFNSEGGVIAQGVSGAYTIAIYGNDEIAETSWNRTTVSGTNGENISLVQTANGIVLSGTNLQNISIETVDDNGTQITLLSTDCSSVLLTSDSESDGTPIVMLDSDGDGTYDKEYNSSDDDSGSALTLIIAIAVGLSAVIAVAIVVIIKIRRKKH